MDKRIAKAPAGYLVYDSDLPVTAYQRQDGSIDHYPKLSHSTAPVSLFKTRNDAARVKRAIQARHRKQANSFDINAGDEQKRCFNLWLARSQNVRISAVVFDDTGAWR